VELEKKSDGLTYRKGDPVPYTGQMIMTTRGINEKWISNFKDGRRDGLFAVFYANGKRKANAVFDRGKLVSGITWKPDGTEGSRIENGTGTFQMFHPDGSKARESVYENGVQIRRSDFPPAGSADGQ
jgi:antitoxin component YwqK of YwqJK toxin-antitoxin module